ncbi:MAG: hypothetical protein IPK78_19945 [Rhodospirillales bacterium]|nr:hypothetical protein [Rhodospirillales bacterium]
MANDPDRYEAWYAQKLWNLLPAIYRAEDSPDFDRKGPIRELVERIGAQAAVVRRSVDRLWEDQSIETCDDWVIAYLGDLLATNLVASLDARGRRVEVAKTIYYRRRKGTVGLLEELATDITGWSARVVEFFRWLARTRHGLDPAIGFPVPPADAGFRLQQAQGLIGARTLTGAGGLADLRNVHGAALTNTAYDEFFHTADVRRGRGMTGWHDIPRLGVFVWRLKSLPVTQAIPVPDATCPNQYTFDPTGRDVPLFAAGVRAFGDYWISPQPHELPGAITADLIKTALPELYRVPRPDAPPSSLGIYHAFGPGYDLVPPGDVASDPRQMAGKPWIDAERGRIVWLAAPTSGPFRVNYHYGFSSEIGAGAYGRPVPHEPLLPISHVRDGALVQMAPDPGGTVVGALVIGDSLTYPKVTDVGPIARAELRAEDKQRPVVRPEPPVAEWAFTGAGDATLLLDGLFISGGGDLVLRGSFERVTSRAARSTRGRGNPMPTRPGGDPRQIAGSWGRPACGSRARCGSSSSTAASRGRSSRSEPPTDPGVGSSHSRCGRASSRPRIPRPPRSP